MRACGGPALHRGDAFFPVRAADESEHDTKHLSPCKLVLLLCNCPSLTQRTHDIPRSFRLGIPEEILDGRLTDATGRRKGLAADALLEAMPIVTEKIRAVFGRSTTLVREDNRGVLRVSIFLSRLMSHSCAIAHPVQAAGKTPMAEDAPGAGGRAAKTTQQAEEDDRAAIRTMTCAPPFLFFSSLLLRFSFRARCSI